MPKTFTVSKDYNNCRFDRWFKLNIGKYPQSLIERLIRKKKIKVNKKRIKTSYRVKLNDKIDIYGIDNLKPSKNITFIMLMMVVISLINCACIKQVKKHYIYNICFVI